MSSKELLNQTLRELDAEQLMENNGGSYGLSLIFSAIMEIKGYSCSWGDAFTTATVGTTGTCTRR